MSQPDEQADGGGMFDRLRKTIDEKLPPEKRTQAVAKAKDLTESVKEKGSSVASSPTGEKVKGAATKAYGTVTMKELREETETTLRKVVEVLCAHEAEIANLRQQIDDLKAELGQ